MSKPHVVILGAGPAGFGAPYKLRHRDQADVTVLEQRNVVGGNAGSFEAGGQPLDYGSHAAAFRVRSDGP
jgi:protoporphyrinogen oxidase